MKITPRSFGLDRGPCVAQYVGMKLKQVTTEDRAKIAAHHAKAKWSEQLHRKIPPAHKHAFTLQGLFDHQAACEICGWAVSKSILEAR